MSKTDTSNLKKKKEPQSEDDRSKQKAQARKNWTPANQQIDDLDLGTRMVDLTFGQEYEKRVNKMFQDKLKRIDNSYFKTNLKCQIMDRDDSMFLNWKLIHKTQKSLDDLSKPKSQTVQGSNDELPLPPTQLYQKFEFVRNIEIDGAAFVPLLKNNQGNFSIEIENQTLCFQSPCIILIEIAIMNDEGTMLKKLGQLIKDYMFVKSEPKFLRKLIAGEDGSQNADQRLEAEKLFHLISPLEAPSDTKIYLVCVTNNDKEKGKENFEIAWDKIKEVFDLTMIDCLYNKQTSNTFDVGEFRRIHVKQLHVQSTPYSNFLSKINNVPEKIDRLELDMANMKTDMANLKTDMGNMKNTLDHIVSLLETKKEDKEAKGIELPEEKE